MALIGLAEAGRFPLEEFREGQAGRITGRKDRKETKQSQVENTK